ncbi:MAG TPA: TIR domain-containing protein [Clostridia bacterium]|nr:TIR domain-containing protein [Clostridia bacterium]
MAKKRVFISYDYSYDRHYKNLLVAWNENDDFDFEFTDTSVGVSVNSTDASVIKSVITKKIKDSTHFLCLIGRYTYNSDWVEWECQKAVELNKKIVAVKINREYNTPLPLIGVGTSWAMSFTFDSIKNAINNA